MTAASVALFPLFAGPRRPARVLGIVSGAVYLEVDPLPASESQDGREHPGAVIALLDDQAAQLPIGIVLPVAAAEYLPVSVDGAAIDRGPITVGWGAITLAETRWPILRWWNPGVPVLPLPPSSIAADVGGHSTEPLAAESAAPQCADPEAAPGPELAGLADGLAALAAGDLVEATQLLIGVGPGLTPAGDDALCGALAALATWAPESSARQQLSNLVRAQVGRTTALSAALLDAAAAGAVVPQLAALLSAFGGSRADLGAAYQQLLRVGASSGAAMGLGAARQLHRLQADVSRCAA